MNSDFEELLNIFNADGVRYLIVGGHAVMAVGYDDSKQQFIIRNSWGTGWGKKGYFRMPYAYLTDPNLADDFWTIRGLTSASASK